MNNTSQNLNASENLFIVTGASGKLGESFIESLKDKDWKVIGFSRRPVNLGVESYVCDLLDEQSVEKIVSDIDFGQFKRITLIHTVGKFKFEGDHPSIIDLDGDGIDDEVFETNVVTLKNLLKFLVLQNKEIKVCAFASVSDKYDIPFWVSYRRAKNIMRKYLKELSEMGQIAALVVNVSTVDTGNENSLRPNADKTYWLDPQDVVVQSLNKLDGLHSYEEIDVFKVKPDFDDDYYLNHDDILEKWRKEMGKDE